MNRRDFLLMRNRQGAQVAELSCERLYMHYHSLEAIQGSGEAGGVSPSSELWDEEPQPVFAERTSEALLGDLERRLEGTELLRIRDAEWLAVDGFGENVKRLLARFRRRGGTVEYRSTNVTAQEESGSHRTHAGAGAGPHSHRTQVSGSPVPNSESLPSRGAAGGATGTD